MTTTLQDTPRSDRLHIGLFGKRNSGKSTLLNAITGQELAVVSEQPGTTTDPVYKSMELAGVGPVVWIDTAGFDDAGELGQKRVGKTRLAVERADIALMLFAGLPDQEREWVGLLKQRRTPVIPVITKIDLIEDLPAVARAVSELCGEEPLLVNGLTLKDPTPVREAIISRLPADFASRSLVGGLAQSGDTVLLVMPQDAQAPKGRLILPQVQTLRELLDMGCTVVSCTFSGMEPALAALAAPPKLIITDSQVFKGVAERKPPASLLTSFSVLMAAAKGDIVAFIAGAAALDRLTPVSRVLIAEACTHAPLSEDIGRVKIPRMLRQRVGQDLRIDVVSGADFPEDLSQYDLIIHCAACMFNRKYVLNRIRRAAAAGTPITNYGVVLAALTGILDRIALPGEAQPQREKPQLRQTTQPPSCSVLAPHSGQ